MAHSKLADGTIAGSTKLMLHGLRNLVEVLGVPWAEAVRMASSMGEGVLARRVEIGADHRETGASTQARGPSFDFADNCGGSLNGAGR